MQETHQELKTIRGHLGRIYTVALSPDGERIVTGSNDQLAIVWEVATGKKLLTELLQFVVSIAVIDRVQLASTGSCVAS
jgi:WD40 repeat protein